MYRKHKSTINICFAGLFVLIFAILYYLNMLYPIFADDIGFTFVSEIGEGLTRKISNVCDIFETQYTQYHVWGGRCVVHFILQLILLLGENTADLLNSIVYLFLSFLIYKIANKGNATKPMLFLLINMSLALILPTFLETVLWLSGSVNYTWGMLIILLFIYPFYTYFIDEKVVNSRMRAFVMFFAGIVAGWTNENTALAMILLIVLLLVYLKITKRCIPHWIISGLVGACVGYLIMILAPGNYSRSMSVSQNLGLDQVSTFKLFKIRLYNLLEGGAIRIGSYLGIYLLFVGLYWKNRHQVPNYTKPLLVSLAFMSASVFAYCVLFPTPTFPERAMFGVVVYALIAIGILFAKIPYKGMKLKTVKVITFVVVAIAFCFVSRGYYIELARFSKISKARVDLIEEQKRKGILDIVFTEKEMLPIDRETLTTDSLNFYNVYFAKYYNINTIKLEKEPHW